MTSSRWRQVLVALVILGARRARAIDMSGPWHEHITVPQIPGYVVDLIETFTQNGTTLSTSGGYSGTIDPDIGVFSMTAPGSQGCPGPQLDGTVQPSGTTFTASGETYYFIPPPHGGCYPVYFDVAGTRCGNGVVDPGEVCDDGNITDGDCCDASCQSAAADGAPCDDDVFCNGADTCLDGACVTHAGDPCVGGAECADVCNENGNLCARPADTPCTDDGIGCTADVCSGGGACVHPMVAGRAGGCPLCMSCDANGQCVSRPRTVPACQQPRSGPLAVHNAAFDGSDALKWAWTSATDVAAADFGDPAALEDYALCVFNGGGSGAVPLFGLDAPAGGTCGNRSCWRLRGSPPGAAGALYKDPYATPDGIVSLSLKPGAAGHARIKLKGKGAHLPLAGTPAPFPLPLLVQLQARSGACWEATYSTASVNDGERLKAP